MLFHYVYVPHSLERMQGWLEDLVKEVWCKPHPECHFGLLEPEFRQVVQATLLHARGHDYLWEPICRIHDICRDQLTEAQRADLAKWFDDNNDIDGLCAAKPGVTPITYRKVAEVNGQLAEELEHFCTDLWSEVRKLKPVQDLLGTLGEHFNAFKKENRKGFCPFCGIARLEGVFSSTQEDYDHYLPKGTYAFNSVTLRNLAPICDKCNKKYKLQKDPLHSRGVRRRAFYVYAPADIAINFSVALSAVDGVPIDPRNLSPKNIEIEITSPGYEEELEAWKEMFNVVNRYKDICCQAESGGAYWLEQVLGEMKAPNQTPMEALAKVKRAASPSRWADMNFLKIPFLQGCQEVGIIRAAP